MTKLANIWNNLNILKLKKKLTLLILCSTELYGYLDTGTLSALIQVVFASFLAGVIYSKSFIKNIFYRYFKRNKDWIDIKFRIMFYLS